MNPIKEQIELLVKLVPMQTQAYSILREDNFLQAKIAREYIEKMKQVCRGHCKQFLNDIQQATLSIVEKCDAIYIPTDNTFCNSDAYRLRSDV